MDADGAVGDGSAVAENIDKSESTVPVIGVDLSHACQTGLFLGNGRENQVMLRLDPGLDESLGRGKHGDGNGRCVNARTDDPVVLHARRPAGPALMFGHRFQIVERRDEDKNTTGTAGNPADGVRDLVDPDIGKADLSHHRGNGRRPLMLLPRGGGNGADFSQIGRHFSGISVHPAQRGLNPGILERVGQGPAGGRFGAQSVRDDQDGKNQTQHFIGFHGFIHPTKKGIWEDARHKM